MSSHLQTAWIDLEHSLAEFLRAHERCPRDCNGQRVGSTAKHYDCDNAEDDRSCVVIEAARRLDVEMRASESPNDR